MSAESIACSRDATGLTYADDDAIVVWEVKPRENV